jgi:hypothetical protein
MMISREAKLRAQIKSLGGQILHEDFGKGWMTNSAATLFKIMVAFGNTDPQELIKAISLIHHRNCRVNSATVERALGLLIKYYDSKKEQ